jgi:DNA-directed RNA polymerase specialized sigma24 family protein
MYNINMNKLSIEKRTQVIKALVEGNSIRATCRIADTAKGTVIRLLRDIGKACAEYQDKHLRNLSSQRMR